jgi:hypothetical protein
LSPERHCFDVGVFPYTYKLAGNRFAEREEEDERRRNEGQRPGRYDPPQPYYYPNPLRPKRKTNDRQYQPRDNYEDFYEYDNVYEDQTPLRWGYSKKRGRGRGRGRYPSSDNYRGRSQSWGHRGPRRPRGRGRPVSRGRRPYPRRGRTPNYDEYPSYEEHTQNAPHDNYVPRSFNRSRGRTFRRGRRPYPSASLGRNPNEAERQYPHENIASLNIPSTSSGRGEERYSLNTPSTSFGRGEERCTCTCNQHNCDPNNSHCVGCICRELEEERRKREDVIKTKSAGKKNDEKKEDAQKNKGEKKAQKLNRKKWGKRGKKASGDSRRCIAVVGHSFIEHLKQAISIERRDTGRNWEQIMGIEGEEMYARYWGLSGATRYKLTELTDYAEENEATRMILEMGSNDLCGLQDERHLADDIIIRVVKFMDQYQIMEKVLICYVTPRTDMQEGSLWTQSEFNERAINFNLRLKERSQDFQNIECWEHDGLTEANPQLFDRWGVHPHGTGMDIYKDSIMRALMYLHNK